MTIMDPIREEDKDNCSKISLDQESSLPVTELLRQYPALQANGIDHGLNDADVTSLRAVYGLNELEKEDPSTLWELILEQFDDTLVKILLVAAMVSFGLAVLEGREKGTDGGADDHDMGLTAYVEPLVILIILILNAIVGVWQESNATAALEALKELQSEHARVLRNGKMQTVNSSELVPGDIVEVRVGDRVPADIRVLHLTTTQLRVDQAQLTGESQSVNKDVDIPTCQENVIQSRTNMLFATTVVVNGIGRGMVCQTGMATEIGKIQQAVQDAGAEEESTPLKKKLDEFGDLLSYVIGVICLLVWIINYQHFFDPVHGGVINGCIYYFKIAVALAVAAIPEGLPTVITTCLALGTRKMAAKNAIVRKLPSVETLGCTSVICSDKTGTLTTNEMSAVEFKLPSASAHQDMQTYNVSGITYAPEGTIEPRIGDVSKNAQVKQLCTIASLCNASSLEYDKEHSKYIRVGEPTEAALKVLVEKLGHPEGSGKQGAIDIGRQTNPFNHAHAVNDVYASQYKVWSTLEFSRDRKSMSVLVKGDDAACNQLFVKGAPEGMVERCSHILLQDGSVAVLDAAGKAKILAQIDEMAARALRCLALAYKHCNDSPLGDFDGTRDHAAKAILSRPPSTFNEIESNMIFTGLVGIIDPPRNEILPMVETCRIAGIRVIMITGDNQLTANAIAVKVGILPEGFDPSRSMTGSQFFSLPVTKQRQILDQEGDTTSGLVFSRTEPKHKQQLVSLLKQRGDVVAMTGDGVNDAPALKQADIGIAMGITGTEVAKEAADMILADDNFATIVSAVEEGRSIYNNMQAFIRYLISSNIGEVAAIFFTAALGLPEGLIPVQLLWVNLVTDGPPATALGFNPADADIMRRLPRRADDALITPWVFFRYMVVGIYVGFACVAVFAYWYMYHDPSDGTGDGHTLLTWYQLTHWQNCYEWGSDFEVADFDGWDLQTDPCRYFTDGKETAMTLSLSVLVAIEMFNALNALSEDGSLLSMPPWSNPYLIVAMFVSFGMHFLILYVEPLAKIFSVAPLDWNEWKLVLAFSLPVILIDEVLKFAGRKLHDAELKKRLAKSSSSKKLQ
jgi:Ca2+-transporting ATPase